MPIFQSAAAGVGANAAAPASAKRDCGVAVARLAGRLGDRGEGDHGPSELPRIAGLAHARGERVAHGARGVARAHVAGEAVVRDQALEPGVAEVDVLARLGREVPHLVRVIQADPLGVLRIVMDDVDVAVVQGGRHEGVPHGTRARRDPAESQHLWQVVLEVPPGVAALAVVAIARESSSRPS